MELARKEHREPRWQAFHFTSHDNPHISKEALEEITRDMTSLAYRQEIEAEDVDEVPGSLWKRQMIEDGRRIRVDVTLDRIVVAIDPPGGQTEAGIVAAGKGQWKCEGKQEVDGLVLDEGRLCVAPHDT